MFENLPRKLKNLAVIVLVLELALVVILTFLLLRTRASFLNYLEIWVALPLSACITAFPLYGLGEVLERQESIRNRLDNVESNVNRMKTEELKEIRLLLERIAPKPEDPDPKPEKPAPKPVKPVSKPEPEPKKTLPEALQYALRFSTDEGMRNYLQGYAASLSSNERPALDALLSGDPETLRQRVRDRLKQV